MGTATTIAPMKIEIAQNHQILKSSNLNTQISDGSAAMSRPETSQKVVFINSPRSMGEPWK